MFEDLQDFLNKNHKKAEDDGEEPKKASNKEMEKEMHDAVMQIAKKYGKMPIHVGVSRHNIDDHSDHDHEVIEVADPFGAIGNLQYNNKVEGITQALVYLINSFNDALPKKQIKEICRDFKGTELKVGDVVELVNHETKKVLKVGYMFCILSMTDDHSKADGTWFEYELHQYQMTIKK